ncbi:MAG: hypothetical protein II875_06660 [Clostridia bacterium]|nr:hypothetical protein [Clostridia bacterium]
MIEVIHFSPSARQEAMGKDNQLAFFYAGPLHRQIGFGQFDGLGTHSDKKTNGNHQCHRDEGDDCRERRQGSALL